MLDCTRDQAHGRVAIRTLKAVSVRGLGGFPHAAQVLQVTRKVRDLGTRSCLALCDPASSQVRWHRQERGCGPAGSAIYADSCGTMEPDED